MATVGEILRRERERQGLSLTIIANETRIRLQYLEFLERDDFESLPGKFFARSFTNQYADRLGANSPELQAALQRQVEPQDLSPTFGQPTKPPANLVAWSDDKFSVEPLPEGTASALSARKLTASVVGLVAVVIACGAIFWLWQRSQLSTTSAQSVAAPPVPVAAPAAKTIEPPPVTQQQVSPPSAQPQQSSESALTPAGANISSTPAPAGTQPPPTPTSGKISLEVIAKETVWIRITVDGKVQVQRALQAGESSVAFAEESARILLGNAGGAEIRLNGSSIGPVGPRGQVRTVDFTPGRFNIIEPQPKKTEPASPPQAVAGFN
ncbi:MAG: DUF4115 domain-containing protein [Acidobacteria bacterium]|nr:DUF4115 domain-containing protein [Acidobacteriota bacterium]